jgi:uracil-DNA glycosylase family 4
LKETKYAPKPDFCTTCPINHVTLGYVPLERGTGTELWIGEAAGADEAQSGKPFVGGAGSWLNSMLRAARIARSGLNIINTIGCQPPENVYPGSAKWIWTERSTARSAVEYCRKHHLEPALTQIQPTRVVALGNEALRAVTNRTGILQWRGSPLPLKGRPNEGLRVVPTLHPAYLMRQANLFSVAVQDLRRGLEIPPEEYDLYPNIDTVRNFRSTVFSFDFEWEPSTGAITMCGLSDRWYRAICVPFNGEFITELKRIFEAAEVLIGHNIVDADTWYFDQLGWKVTAELHDTMLAQHLIQPDMRHGLGFVGSVFTSKVFWKGTGEEQEDEDGNILPTGAQWKTWDSPDAIPRQFGGYGGCHSADEAWRLYNARDTDGTLQAEAPIFKTLRDFKQYHVYRNVSVPAAYICRDINRTGLRIDPTRVSSIREDLHKQIIETEQRLPEGLKPYDKPITRTVPAIPGTYKSKTFKCKGRKKTKTVHPERIWSVNQPGVTVCVECGLSFKVNLKEVKRVKEAGTKRIVPWNSNAQVIAYAKTLGCKEVPHAKTGNSSGDKRARRIWGREHTEFTIVDILKKLSTQKNSFAKEALQNLKWVKFRLAVTGTSEGRLSCSGQYPANLNLQNQPKAIRKIFIPDKEGYGILSHDIVQGENMLTAWLAKDWERWERLNTPGFDEHSYMASRFFNQTVGPDNPLRKPGKVINHGRNYGLGERKTQDYLAAEGFSFSIGDIREMIAIWKKENARTAAWQQETINTAQKQSYLENPFGRRRWFQGRDFATKALAFLPASTLADMVLRMMIAHYPSRFGTEIMDMQLAVVADLCEAWRIALQVHDDIVTIGPDESYLEQAQRSRAIMTMPWKELDGFAFQVETKYSTTSWGDSKVLQL